MATPLPARNIFDGTSAPVTSTFKTALGALRDYLAETIGVLGGGPIVPSLNGGQLAGMRNRIINGDMRIDQRNGGAVAPLAASTTNFLIDRMNAYVQGAATTGQRQTGGGPESSVLINTILINGAAGLTAVGVLQGIESANSRDMAGKVVTLSIWAYQNTGVSLPVYGAINRYVTLDTAAGDVADVVLSMSPSSLPTGVWTKLTGTGALTSAATKGIEPYIGVSGTIGSGTQVMYALYQLELGSVATAFEQRPIGLELAMCQRYYEKSFPQGTKPAQALGTVLSGANRFSAGRAGGSGANNYGFISYKTPKRIAPTTIVGYSPISANALPLDSTLGVDCSSYSVFSGEPGIYLSVQGAASTAVGNGIDWAWTADAEIY